MNIIFTYFNDLYLQFYLIKVYLTAIHNITANNLKH